MSVPGSNILNMALTAIAQQQFQWFEFASRNTNSVGQFLATYAAPVALQGSVQAVPRNLYAEYGLDFDKLYRKFFVSQNVIDVDRDVSGDIIVFNGENYECLSVTPWYSVDGWVEVLAVRAPPTPLAVALTYPTAGNYNTSAQLTFTLQFNQNVVVIGTPYIALSALAGMIGGNAVYTGGSGTPTLTFAYTVQSGDTATGIATASPVAGVVNNAAGALPANATFTPPDLSGVTLNA